MQEDDLLKPGFNQRLKNGFYAELDVRGRLRHFGFYRGGQPRGWIIGLTAASARATRTVSAEFQAGHEMSMEGWVKDHIQTIYSDAEEKFLLCSFCPNSDAEVAKLIAGPVIQTLSATSASRLVGRFSTTRRQVRYPEPMKLSSLLGRLAVCLLAGNILAPAQSLTEFEKTVTEFTLSHGLHFIIIERHQAPVVSFNTYVNAGAVEDPQGKTGIAHMMEHMAFKGTETIGTKNWTLEKKALEEVERAYDALAIARQKNRDVKKAEITLKAAMDRADSYVVDSEYDKIVEQNGGVGLNAGTGEDQTNYYYSFPVNRIELWFLLESERFLRPVFREFYKERDVVREERRMRVESSAQGLLVEKLLMTTFDLHPYRISPGGLAEDIENFRQPEAYAFFRKYYVPSNITIGIAGDVDPRECRRMAEKYFGRLEARPAPPQVAVVEPGQKSERRVSIAHKEQPILVIAYRRPNHLDKDDLALDVAAEVLAGGRTSAMYKELVRDQKVALAAGAQPSFPGEKFPNLFLVFVVPNQGRTVAECETASLALVEQLKKAVDPAALQRVKTKLRAGLIGRLASNSGLAGDLTSYHVAYGTWKRMFTDIEDLEKVTGEDVMRVARTYLVPEGRTVAWTIQPKESK